MRAGLAADWLPHSEAMVALFIVEIDRPPDIDVSLLAMTYDLAARVAELAAHLARGLDIPQIATRLGIGVGTARWYLKRVLEKTNTHRQAELVSLIIRGFAGRANQALRLRR